MAKEVKSIFLRDLRNRVGELNRLAGSLSLFMTTEIGLRVYIRYSKLHGQGITWYGLRETDLQQLQGFPSLLCFLWNGQKQPLLVPYSDFEDVFQSTTPAGDGQYKVQVYTQETTELYIARVGRFNVEGYIGWEPLERLVGTPGVQKTPDLSHTQVQTLLGSIGNAKKFDVWIPSIDRSRLDWSITHQFQCRDMFSLGGEQVESILHEIDVVWLGRGSNELKALFEVEHSTPIYSGLLRFNDIHLYAPNLQPRFSIVANDERRSLYVRQLNRPTFRMSGLSELCTFLNYSDVFNWHQRIFEETNNVQGSL